MKKVLSVFLVCIVLFNFVACNKNDNKVEKNSDEDVLSFSENANLEENNEGSFDIDNTTYKMLEHSEIKSIVEVEVEVEDIVQEDITVSTNDDDWSINRMANRASIMTTVEYSDGSYHDVNIAFEFSQNNEDYNVRELIIDGKRMI